MPFRRRRFLCPNHATWLANHPSQATHCWLNSMDSAQTLFADQQWRSALAYAGCAYETADILLATPGNQLPVDLQAEYARLQMFSRAVLLTMDTLLALDQPRSAKQLCDAAIQRLEQLTQRGLHTSEERYKDERSRTHISAPAPYCRQLLNLRRQRAALQRRIESNVPVPATLH